MPRLTQNCPVCNRPLVLEHSTLLKADGHDVRLKTYKCGHFFSEDASVVDLDSLDFTSADGQKKARLYQQEGIKFIIASEFNCVIGDQMRLGKTPQALLALRNRYSQLDPCLIIVRATNLWQWIREYKVWTDPEPLGIFPIIGTKGFIPPGFHTYIISMDTFSRAGTCKECGHSLNSHDTKTGKCKGNGRKCTCEDPVDNHDSMVDKLREMPFKLIIADEAHSFKNTDSNRSQALVGFLKEKNTVDAVRELFFKCPMCQHEWTVNQEYKIVNGVEQAQIRRTEYCAKCSTAVGMAGQKNLSTKRNCGIILLTGTAIKNRADEYFVPLNLVAPTLFPSQERFRRRYLMQDYKGQWSRISPYALDSFKQAIAPYVLRREKEDVYTDLPPLNRMFTVIEPEKDALANEYNKILDKMEGTLAHKANPTYWDMQDDLMTLRRICGLMKVPWTADHLEASMMDSDNSRFAVGIHHHDVRDILSYKLSHLGCLKLSGEDSAEHKDWIMRKFETSPERVLVINMLAGGVGMDFHYCNNVIVLERQWSFADEEQFEFRFYNPDRSIMGNRSTNVEYIIAKGTVDEIFYDMVEVKKSIQGETIGTQWDVKTQPRLFKSLIEQTISHRL